MKSLFSSSHSSQHPTDPKMLLLFLLLVTLAIPTGAVDHRVEVNMRGSEEDKSCGPPQKPTKAPGTENETKPVDSWHNNLHRESVI